MSCDHKVAQNKLKTRTGNGGVPERVSQRQTSVVVNHQNVEQRQAKEASDERLPDALREGCVDTDHESHDDGRDEHHRETQACCE